MLKVKDKFWLWTHEAGICNDGIFGRLIKDSRITPVEAALYMGFQNILFVKSRNKPQPSMYEKYAISFTPFKKVVWSIVGDGSCNDDINSKDSDVVLIPRLAIQFPNICGVIMDDFFR